MHPPGLYIVATPIGNLGDITLRALELLKISDLIVCEDTRVTAKLLSHYGISVPALSYNDHNAPRQRPKIMQALREGKTVALLSDAGTPLISDPGYKLVREALTEEIAVSTLPGASSVLAALCVAGLPTDQFFFAGFLPARSEARAKAIKSCAAIPATLVILATTRQLAETFQALAHGLGNRDAAMAREITKLHEEIRRGTLCELAAHYETHGDPRGEAVIVIAPPPEDAPMDSAELKRQLTILLASHSVKEAAALLAETTGLPRKDIYTLALTLNTHG